MVDSSIVWTDGLNALLRVLLQKTSRPLEGIKVKKSRSMKKPAKLKKNSTRVSRATLAILLGVIAAISVVVIALAGAGSSDGVAALTNPKPSPEDSKAIQGDTSYRR